MQIIDMNINTKDLEERIEEFVSLTNFDMEQVIS